MLRELLDFFCWHQEIERRVRLSE